jgi:hypothetical protein
MLLAGGVAASEVTDAADGAGVADPGTAAAEDAGVTAGDEGAAETGVAAPVGDGTDWAAPVGDASADAAMPGCDDVAGDGRVVLVGTKPDGTAAPGLARPLLDEKLALDEGGRLAPRDGVEPAVTPPLCPHPAARHPPDTTAMSASVRR